MLVRNDDEDTGSVRHQSNGSIKRISNGSVKLLQAEPDFMKYIKGVNLKSNDAAYL